MTAAVIQGSKNTTTVQITGRMTFFGGALEVANLSLAITSTGLRASAAGSFAGTAVIADVDLRKRGFEIQGDKVRFAVNASNVNLGSAVGRLWGAGAPALINQTIGSATFDRLSSQNRGGKRGSGCKTCADCSVYVCCVASAAGMAEERCKGRQQQRLRTDMAGRARGACGGQVALAPQPR